MTITKEDLSKQFDDLFDPRQLMGHYEKGVFVRGGKHEKLKEWWLSKIDLMLEQNNKDNYQRVLDILEKERLTWAKESIGEIAVKSIIETLKQDNIKLKLWQTNQH